MSDDCEEEKGDAKDEFDDWMMMLEILQIANDDYREIEKTYDFLENALFEHADELTSEELHDVIEDLHDFADRLEELEERVEELTEQMFDEKEEYDEAKKEENECEHKQSQVGMELEEKK
jgi:chromosome segregation ATPase